MFFEGMSRVSELEVKLWLERLVLVSFLSVLDSCELLAWFSAAVAHKKIEDSLPVLYGDAE